ncbi:AAA family ATPase [Alicyclobacillus fastidiosus]|uniref:AAA family ATPase n=1 Tax=Alicyclobacillus fastidiosus TaxID=392011 RepID=A0ABV5ACS4_9BACL|nr:AAA family ATPase [Alicyclobacillus fastidiosus]WEH11238.1 AAA family ATPase [Alicyclobacillus fastidiosus]
MRLQALRIDHFGPYHNQTWTFHSHGFHILFGPNEAGKSSLLAAIRGGLFGNARLAEGTAHARPGAHVGMQLRQESGSVVTLERSLTKKTAPNLSDEDGRKATGQAELVARFPELRQVEQLLYETFFTLQLADLVAFSDKPNALISQLFGLRALLVNPYALEEAVEKSALEVYNPHRRASRPRLNQALRAWREVKGALQASPDQAAWYRHAKLRREELAGRLEDERQALQAVGAELDLVERAASLRPTVLELLEVEAGMAALGAVPGGHYDTWAQVPFWRRRIAELAGERNRAADQIARLESDIRHLAKTASQAELRGDVQAWRLRAQELQTSVQQWEDAVKRSLHAKDEGAKALRGIPHAFDSVGMARLAELTAAGELIREAKAYEQAVSTRSEAARQLQVALSWEAEQRQSLEAQARLASASEQDARAAIEAQDVELRDLEHGYRKDFERLLDWRDAASSRSQPVGRVSPMARSIRPLIVLVSAAGVAVEAASHQFFAAGILAVAFVLSLVSALSGLRSAKAGAMRNQAQPPYLTRWKGAVEKGSVDAILEQISRKIQEVELQRRHLERTKSLLRDYEEAIYRRRLCESECAAALKTEREVESSYQASLDGVHLTGGLWTSAELVQFAESARARLHWQSVQDGAEQVLKEASERVVKELLTLQVWISEREILNEPDLERAVSYALSHRDSTSAAQSAIASLLQVLARREQMIEQALQDAVTCEGLKEKREALVSEVERMDLEIASCQQSVERVYRELGIVVPEDFDLSMERETARRRLQQRRERLLQALVVECTGERRAFRVVQKASQSSLAALHAEVSSLRDTFERRGETVESLQEELWAIDRSLEESQLGLAGDGLRWQAQQLEGEIVELKQNFAAMAIVKSLSVRARVAVESEQSSPLLAKASEYLADITANRYPLLRVPLGSDGLQHVYLVNGEGQTFAMTEVSRGTREQVYLALRLAVIRQYREQGIILPVVLDDPLVNFDDDRAQRVMDLLVEESRQQPIIYLTCHERLLSDVQSRAGVHLISMK